MSCTIGSMSGNISCGGVSIPFAIGGISGGSTTKDLPYSNVPVHVTGNTFCPSGGFVSVSFIQ